MFLSHVEPHNDYWKAATIPLFIFIFITMVDGSTVASGQACEPRVPGSSPDIRWPLFFGITAKWPKIT